MKPKGRAIGTPGDWIEHAKSDLRVARIAAADDLVRLEQVCFHAQQAAEKAIKAVLLARHLEFPLTHDIEQLLEIAERGGMLLPADVREAGMLTPYAVEVRYPGYWFEVTEDDAEEAIQAAACIVEWAESELYNA
jgi:HEPN domain-containing protein